MAKLKWRIFQNYANSKLDTGSILENSFKVTLRRKTNVLRVETVFGKAIQCLETFNKISHLLEAF